MQKNRTELENSQFAAPCEIMDLVTGHQELLKPSGGKVTDLGGGS